jgi:uncharacterized spore protein YtfJ
MDIYEMVHQAYDAMSVKRVYGDPYEKDGVMIIPVAKVRGGGGAGYSRDDDDEEGSGGGYGISATPAGAYVIKDGRVKWKPAFNLNRAILGGQTVAIVALLVVRAIARPQRSREGLDINRAKGLFGGPFGR